jgi:hypothetical protein
VHPADFVQVVNVFLGAYCGAEGQNAHLGAFVENRDIAADGVRHNGVFFKEQAGCHAPAEGFDHRGAAADVVAVL